MMMMKTELPGVSIDDYDYRSANDGDDVTMDWTDFMQILEEDPCGSQSDHSYSHTSSSQEDTQAPDLVQNGSGAFKIENTYSTYKGVGTLSVNSAQTTGAQRQGSTPLSEMSLISNNSGTSSMPGFASTDGYSSFNGWSEGISGGLLQDYLPDNAQYPSVPFSGECIIDTKLHAADPQPADLWPGINLLGIDQKCIGFASGSSNSIIHSDIDLYRSFSRSVVDGAPDLPLHWTQSFESSRKPPIQVGDARNNQLLFSNGTGHQSYGIKNEVQCSEVAFGSEVGNFAGNTVALAPHTTTSFGNPEAEVEDDFFDFAGDHQFIDTCNQMELGYQIPTGYGEYTDMKAALNPVPSLGITETDPEGSLVSVSDDDQDPDVCIIENIDLPGRAPSLIQERPLVTAHQFPGILSAIRPEKTDVPGQIAPSLAHGGSHVNFNQCSSSTSILHSVGEGTRSRANNERLIFRAAMKDFSQPKSEATLPDGVLAVPLLRHQRIALSWMVQKETTSWYCSGGILADDQGLGKTVSTIALILKERPPSSRMPKDTDNGGHEMLDLDGGGYQSDKLKMTNVEQTRSGSLARSLGTDPPAKGRPAGGTLIVCPKSVIRQWEDELHSKVTSKANLSVYMYYGNNRIMDPYELAKYDVVLTTYSIVSMEVPKQPANEKDDENLEPDDGPPSSNKKRKCISKSSVRCLKKGKEDMLQESSQRPLPRVGWFRVVLDEAQSIKNHKTQVAQACWGLRSKRRWCLSGTPLQNAVDDLYSYFRFLRYDPYDGYKQFCDLVKFPISKNPAKGYQKLQAVLKTVMLRRTKATLIDGEPIVSLPPKTVELRKVDFSREERDFYSRMEADSRAQFAEYEADGTIQQNYVNILLMLLRLRQACDHPLLVKGFDFTSVQKSADMAKKLCQEKKLSLLTCLEASLVVCGICRDYPEDAVVSICGHVFCNQCINEQLTGDDNQCPAKNCRVQLNSSSVFSRDTLKRCLADHGSNDRSPSCSGYQSSPHSEVIQPCEPFKLQNSSKIQAVLHVLQSLNKPSDDVVENQFMESSGTLGSCSVSSGSPSVPPGTDGSVTDMKKGLSNCVSVGKEKAIIFSQWTRMLDLLEACLKESSIQYRRLDGTMTVGARDKAVRDFNTLPEVSVIIMSLKAASLGLNMVAACHVVLLDLWWNPTTEDQAVDRAHRIGQTRPVRVLRLTVKDTVEDRILALQQKKREMVASAFGEDETGGTGTRLTVEDLRYLFKL